MTASRRTRVCLAGLTMMLIAGSLTISSAQTLPRTSDGRPNLQGIWQATGTTAADVGGDIPYQPWAAAKKAQNFKSRQTADPLSKCYLPGVPRLMYLAYPFQIFQTPAEVAITFAWAYDFRVIHTDGSSAPPGIDFWLGDSRGHWDGDTLVVDVTNHNDKTWFDKAGNFHSDQLHVIERYTLMDANTIQYEATIQDPKVFTKAWTIRVPLRRQEQLARLTEYHCNAEAEEKSGAFERNPHTWYPKP